MAVGNQVGLNLRKASHQNASEYGYSGVFSAGMSSGNQVHGTGTSFAMAFFPLLLPDIWISLVPLPPCGDLGRIPLMVTGIVGEQAVA
jgi:hypothetical protein